MYSFNIRASDINNLLRHQTYIVYFNQYASRSSLQLITMFFLQR